MVKCYYGFAGGVKMKSQAVKKIGTLSTLFVMSTAYIAVFSSVQGFKAMLPLIREDFGISSAQAGLYSTFFYSSGVILAVFTGKIVDSIGPRKGLIGGVIIIASLMVLHTLMPLFSLLLVLALLSGIGFSVVTPSINKGIIEMVDPSKRAISNGIVHAGGGIGGILGSSLLPLIGEHYGWRTALVFSASLAFLLALVLIKLFHPNEDKKENETKTTFKDDFLVMVKNPLIWMMSLIGIATGLALGNMTIHYALFLTGDLTFSPTLAGVALSTFMVGGIIGNPMFGFINDKYFNSNRRGGLFGLGLVVSAFYMVLALIVLPSDFSYSVILMVSFVFGLFAFAIMGLMFTALGDIVGAKYMGTGTGILLVFTRLSMVIGPPIIGHLADVSGTYQVSFMVISMSVFVLITIFYIGTYNHRSLLRRGTS